MHDHRHHTHMHTRARARMQVMGRVSLSQTGDGAPNFQSYEEGKTPKGLGKKQNIFVIKACTPACLRARGGMLALRALCAVWVDEWAGTGVFRAACEYTRVPDSWQVQIPMSDAGSDPVGSTLRSALGARGRNCPRLSSTHASMVYDRARSFQVRNCFTMTPRP